MTLHDYAEITAGYFVFILFTMGRSAKEASIFA